MTLALSQLLLVVCLQCAIIKEALKNCEYQIHD